MIMCYIILCAVYSLCVSCECNCDYVSYDIIHSACHVSIFVIMCYMILFAIYSLCMSCECYCNYDIVCYIFTVHVM